MKLIHAATFVSLVFMCLAMFSVGGYVYTLFRVPDSPIFKDMMFFQYAGLGLCLLAILPFLILFVIWVSTKK